MWIHVVIPVYNAKKYLKEAVDSVLGQPYRAIDIVLVDDGSTDGSSELCDEIARGCDRIHVIHQANGGVSKARNTGIEYILSQSDGTGYIAFLDADDLWTKDFFTEEILGLMENHYDFLGFQSCNCNADCSRRAVPVELKEGIYRGGNNNVWLHSSQAYTAALYSAQLIEKYDLQFTVDLKYSEDKVFLMQILYLAETILLKNKLMYLYRQNVFSAVHTRKWGISYYIPIIEGWLKSDRQMLCWKNEERGELRQGRTLAAIYIMDMIEEHYMCFGTDNSLKNLFQGRNDLVELLDELPDCGNSHAKDVFHQLQRKPEQLKLRCYCKGMMMRMKQIVSHSKIAYIVFDRVKFSVKI